MTHQVAAHPLKPQDFDSITVGDEFGPIALVVGTRLVREYAFAADDFNSWYFQDSPFGGPIAPSGLLAQEVLGLKELKYDPDTDQSLHARQECHFFEPVLVGQRVVLKGSFTDKYIRRDKPYFVLEGEVQSEDGRRLIWYRSIEMVTMKPGLQVGEGTKRLDAHAGSSPAGDRIVPRTSSLPVAAQARADLAVDTPLPSITKRPTRKQIFAFSAVDAAWRNMHTDPEVARSIGLKDVIVQGLQTESYLAEICTTFFGKSWFTSGRSSVVYIKPVYLGDELVVRGIVSGRVDEAEGTRIGLELWCEDAEGTVVTAGRASALAG